MTVTLYARGGIYKRRMVHLSVRVGIGGKGTNASHSRDTQRRLDKVKRSQSIAS